MAQDELLKTISIKISLSDDYCLVSERQMSVKDKKEQYQRGGDGRVWY
jgi:hypothetical protein